MYPIQGNKILTLCEWNQLHSSTPSNSRPNVVPDLDLSALLHECPVCCEEIDDPRVFHCGHNLCANCAKMLVRRTDTTASPTMSLGFHHRLHNRVVVSCPMCKRGSELRLGEDLPVNYALKDTVEKMKSLFSSHVSTSPPPKPGTMAVCADCSKSSPQTKTFVCADCSSRYYHTFSLPETQREEMALWKPKKLCSLCICRSHLGHQVYEANKVASKEKILAFAQSTLDRKQAIVGISTKFMEKMMEELQPPIADELSRRFDLLSEPVIHSSKPPTKVELRAATENADQQESAMRDFILSDAFFGLMKKMKTSAISAFDAELPNFD